MKKRFSRQLGIGALSSVIVFSFSLNPARADQTLPILSARGGAIPADYSGWTFWNWGSPLETSSLTDGNPATGLTLWGLDDVVQPNGFSADTSAFALFRYVIPADAPAVRFTVMDKVEGTDYLSSVNIEPWRPDLGFWAQARYGDTPRVPTSFSVTFYPDGNDGTYSVPTDIWGSNLNNIQNSSREVMFVIYGGAALSLPGQHRLDLYEVSATVIPEPAFITLLPFFGLAAMRLRHPSKSN